MTARQLTELILAGATDPGRLARGEDYVRYLHGLQVGDGRASASVQAKRVYPVSLDWSGSDLEGRCTCYDYNDGAFCKHLVALGLAVLDTQQHLEPATDTATASVIAYLGGLGRDELLDLVCELIGRDPESRSLVLARAAAAGHADALDPGALTAEISAALAVRGYIDYRRSFDVARDVQEVLDRLERLLDAGAADAVRPALLRALTRLRKVTLRVDDSAGVLGDATQRSADLYARSCREGRPDPVALAEWLVKFRQDSPGWPETTLADFVAAFDERGLRNYRQAIARWDQALRGADPSDRFDVDRALVELADHDGDLDAAIVLLTRDAGRERYADVVRRLVAADRTSAAADWLDRAVAAGRVSGFGSRQVNAFSLGAEEAARLYYEVGRSEDALEVLRRDFSAHPGVVTWDALLELAGELGREAAERTWASAEAERLAQQPYVAGAALVQIQLSEGRLDEAWQTAERFGAGHAWEELAVTGARDRPAAAAELYRPVVEQLLVHADTSKYAPAALRLATMRELYAAAGQPEVFAAYLAELRERYVRRTSFIRALDRRGLT